MTREGARLLAFATTDLGTHDIQFPSRVTDQRIEPPFTALALSEHVSREGRFQ